MEVVDIKDVAKERVMHDLKAVITGAEELLRVTANNAGAEYAGAKQKVERNLTAARATDASMRQSIGVGAGLRLVIAEPADCMPDQPLAGKDVLSQAIVGLFSLTEIRTKGDIIKDKLLRFFMDSFGHLTTLLPSQGMT